MTYHSFWSTHKGVQKEGHIRIVKRIAVINGEVPDVFSVGQILLPLSVSCSFCEKRTFKPSRCVFSYNMGKVSTVKLGGGNCDDFASIEQASCAFPAHD